MANVWKGFPLSIVVLGGILRKKQTLAEWKSVLNNISSYLINGYDQGRTFKEILLQSYDDLPYHLKPCFLHLANFPRDYKIEAENLCWMWVAEGLVTTSMCDRTRGTKSLEDVVDDYLSELAQAGLVDIVGKTSEGGIQDIQMHDHVRLMCLEKATEDNFLNTIDLRSSPDQQLNTSDYYSEKRLLRMAIYLSKKNSINSLIKDSLSKKAPKHLRSLFIILDGNEADGNVTDEDECRQLMRCICSEFKLLRVLVLNSIDLNGRLTSQVESLMHLRYLSLNETSVTELPSSIGNLRFLEILDLRVLGELLIPNTLWKLFRLRHLLLPYYMGYEIKWPWKRLRVDTLICLERIDNLLVKKLRTKDLLKIKNMRNLSIHDEVSKEAMLDIIHVLKSGRLLNCVLKVKGDVISEKPKILSDIVCNCFMRISGQISVQESVDFLLPRKLKELSLVECRLKDDPMRILGSLSHLEALGLDEDSYVGTKMTCRSRSFPLLKFLGISKLKNLKVWELEHGSMPNLEYLQIEHCMSLNRISGVLPSSLQTIELEGDGSDLDEEGGVNFDISGAQNVDPYGSGRWLKEAVLKGEYDKVVILGNGGLGKLAGNAMKHLYRNREMNRGFDAIARTWVSSRKSTESGGGRSALLPRRNLQQLLRDLRDTRLQSRGHHQDLSKMSCEDLIAEIKQVMQQRKCLLILLNLEVRDFDHLEAVLENTFGRREELIRGSKIVITSQSNIQPHAAAAAECHVFKLRPPTPLQTWQMLIDQDSEYCDTNAGIKWNMLRHCSVHPLLTDMLVRLVKMKENIIEWASQHEELTDSSPLDSSKIFELCYNDLPLHLRRCLIYLANFPEQVEISTKKLYKMWIAGGFVGSEQSEESLENLARTYLTQLVRRGMITVLKRGPARRVRTCQLKFALRDLCLCKAKEDRMLTIVDQFEHTAATTSNAELETQQLAVHLDQISLTQLKATSLSLEEKLSSLKLSISPTSVLFFHDDDDDDDDDVNDPLLYNEENWEWLLYICKNFELLRVLDLEGMRMTKGSLPIEIGNLTQLRYLSLRGTWVTQLPPSIEDLINLQTLDLRVLKSIFIPDVLWKLDCLVHLCLPDFITQETAKLRLRGLNSPQTLVNLSTNIVCLNDLVELKLLRKISIKTIHALDELVGVLKQLSTSLGVSINSEIINADPTILSRFKNLHKLKIKGPILVELHLQMFPSHLKELTLKHTKLEKDPLLVLEKLPELRRLFLDLESFLGKTMTFSKDFYQRPANLILCSLSNLELLYVPIDRSEWRSDSIVIIDCWRLEISTNNSSNTSNEELVRTNPKCFDMSPLKKGLQSFTCW